MIGINGRYSTRFTRYWETTIGHKSIHMPLHSSATQLVDIENNSSFLIPGEFPESVTRSEIRRLLQDIPKPKEIRYWLRHFAQAKSRAIIKVSGAVLANAETRENLASALAFLHRVGLSPIVIHGVGKQLVEILGSTTRYPRQINEQKQYKLRDTISSKQIVSCARQESEKHTFKLCERIEAYGTRAMPLVRGVAIAEERMYGSMAEEDEDTTVSTGSVIGIDMEYLEEAMSFSAVPVISPIADTPDGCAVAVKADDITFSLAKLIKPLKLIFITSQGGIFIPGWKASESSSQHGETDYLTETAKHVEVNMDTGRIANINVPEDYNWLLSQDWVRSDEIEQDADGLLSKVLEIRNIMNILPKASSVCITSATGLLRELFTHEGAGTLFRRQEAVHCYTKKNLNDVDMTTLFQLVETAFQRKLRPEWIESFPQRLYRLYLSQSYNGAAILTNEPGIHIPYLDKFAVTSASQGEGTGNSVWNAMKKRDPLIFWRSRNHNFITPWYFQRADGSYKMNKNWTMFWTGDLDPSDISKCVKIAGLDNTPASFLD